jgi:hypothetical protein
MPRHAATRHFACAVLILAAPAAFAAPPQGAAVILRDGHVLRGYVMQPSETIVDPISHEPITLHKGIFLVDDLCRRYFFSHAYVDRAENRDFDIGRRLTWDVARSFPDGMSLPPIREVLDVGAWDDQWNRSYSFRPPSGKPITLSQHLSILTPYYARINANCIDPVTKKDNRYPWTSYYPTRELGPKTVLALLATHPNLKDTKGLKDDQRADRRFQIFNFLVQAGWMPEAEKELARIERDFPKEKDKIERARTGIKKLVAMDRRDEIKVAHAAGRHEEAQKLLAAFPTDDADEQTQTEIRALKAKYELAGSALKRARDLLTSLPKQVSDAGDQALFSAATAAMLAELNLDQFLKKGDNDESRLERFLTQAEQAERLAKQDMPHRPPEELLALAVTGWLSGSGAGETKPDAARRIWQARLFLQQYQKAADPAVRAALLRSYQEKGGLDVAEMAQVIATLPPPEPLVIPGTGPIERKAAPVAGSRGPTYRLQLPPEYHSGRPYPVLIALGNAGESSKTMLERWGEAAAKYGYILAAPDWDLGMGGRYLYTAEEHAAVLDALRDLHLHWTIDTDRVFLTGYGEGGNMAYDVGLAHPDLFAGVIPINGQPRFHARAYWTNAMELPFYVVWGEYMGGPAPVPDKKTNGNLVNYELFKDHWIGAGFPAVGVQHKGRGLEWFADEVQNVFEWMAQKRRHNPTGKVGFRDVVNRDTEPWEFRADQRTLRPGDNRFYWLSVDGPSPRHQAEAITWTGKTECATVAAKIANGNQIGVFAEGVRQVTVWLARGMIDFDKPVAIRLNFEAKPNREVKPSLEVLLEDFYQRGDRQRLFVARIDVTAGKK